MARIRELGARVQVGTTAEVARFEPVRDWLEEQGDRLGRSSGVVRDVVTDLVEPAGAEIAKPRNHQVILGREVAIERRLGNAGFRDQRVDAGSLDPDIAKQSRCCRQEAVPGGLSLDSKAGPRHASDDGARMKSEDV